MVTSKTNVDSRQNEHYRGCRFGHGGIRTGTRAAAGRLAEVGLQGVVSSLRAVSLLPNDVVGRVDDIAAIRLLSPEVDRGSNSDVL
jgi:hypothetical protein